MIVKCEYCKKKFEKSNGAVKRSENRGMKHFCSLQCSGQNRRLHKSQKQLKAEKAEYDRKFREKNAERLKKEKAEWFKRTYNPEKAAIERKANMHKHVEYCRQPWYKEWKKQYDKKHLANKNYGEYGEAALILKELEDILETRDLKYNWGQTNKSQNRKRQWQQNNRKS